MPGGDYSRPTVVGRTAERQPVKERSLDHSLAVVVAGTSLLSLAPRGPVSQAKVWDLMCLYALQAMQAS